MVKRLKIGIGLLVAGWLLLIGYNWSIILSGQPQAAMHSELDRLGWEVDELVALEEGYSSRWGAWTAHGHYRSPAGEVHLRMAKASPFSKWSLQEYRREQT